MTRMNSTAAFLAAMKKDRAQLAKRSDELRAEIEQATQERADAACDMITHGGPQNRSEAYSSASRAYSQADSRLGRATAQLAEVEKSLYDMDDLITASDREQEAAQAARAAAEHLSAARSRAGHAEHLASEIESRLATARAQAGAQAAQQVAAEIEARAEGREPASIPDDGAELAAIKLASALSAAHRERDRTKSLADEAAHAHHTALAGLRIVQSSVAEAEYRAALDVFGPIIAAHEATREAAGIAAARRIVPVELPVGAIEKARAALTVQA